MSSISLALLLALLSCPRGEVLTLPPAAATTAVPGVEEELARVRSERELDPDDPQVLERYSALLGKSGDLDGQIAYLLCALESYDTTELDDPKEKEKTLKRLWETVGRLDASISALQGHRDAYLKDLAWALDLYDKNKKRKNALEIAGRILRHRAKHSLAQGVVQRILAVDPALADEANRLLAMAELSRPRAFRVRWASEHREWAKAGSLTTRGYACRSNIGYDTLQRAARGLDQIARFYAEFYGTGSSATAIPTKVHLCRTRAEWREVAAGHPMTQNPGMLAFLHTLKRYELSSPSAPRRLVSTEFEIFAFDPRDIGRPLESLWPSMWHEASHQYMELATGLNSAPLWLHEGMACYFEGALVDRFGEVTVGLPAQERLRNLYTILAQGERPIESTIEASGGLTANQYAVAWGLVYYLRHARERDGQTTPRDLLVRAIQACAREQQLGPALFRDAVLTPLKLDLAAFEQEWIASMRALHERESAPEKALQAVRDATARELAARREPNAIELFEETLARSPEDPQALLGLARIHQGQSEKARNKDLALKDEALLWARRAHRAAAKQGMEGEAKAATVIATAMDPGGFQRIADAERGYRRNVEKILAAKLDQGRRKSALAIADSFYDGVLGDRRREELVLQLRQEGVTRLERVLRVFDGATTDGLVVPSGPFQIESGELACTVARPEIAPVFLQDPVASQFALEGEILLADPNVVVAFCSTQGGSSDATGFLVRPANEPKTEPPGQRYTPFDLLGYGEVGEIEEAFLAKEQRYGYRLSGAKRSAKPVQAGAWVRFRLVRDGLDTLRLELDDEKVAERKVEPHDTGSGAGLIVWGGSARVRALRVVEFDLL